MPSEPQEDAAVSAPPIRYWLSKAGPKGTVCGAKQGDVHVTNWYPSDTVVEKMVNDIRMRLARKMGGIGNPAATEPPAQAAGMAFGPVSARMVPDADAKPLWCAVCDAERLPDCDRYPGDSQDGVASFCPQATPRDHQETTEG